MFYKSPNCLNWDSYASNWDIIVLNKSVDNAFKYGKMFQRGDFMSTPAWKQHFDQIINSQSFFIKDRELSSLVLSLANPGPYDDKGPYFFAAKIYQHFRQSESYLKKNTKFFSSRNNLDRLREAKIIVLDAVLASYKFYGITTDEYFNIENLKRMIKDV